MISIISIKDADVAAARVISGTRKFEHITLVLKQLHWLPINSMLTFRDGVLASSASRA